MTEAELLKVLDMSEEEQWKKMRPFIDADGDTYERGVYSNCLRRQVFADLAFRLRDETKGYTALWKETSLHKALLIVTKFLQCREENRKFESTQAITYREIDWAWWAIYAKPIHWIIASLIAKGKEDV